MSIWSLIIICILLDRSVLNLFLFRNISKVNCIWTQWSRVFFYLQLDAHIGSSTVMSNLVLKISSRFIVVDWIETIIRQKEFLDFWTSIIVWPFKCNIKFIWYVLLIKTMLNDHMYSISMWLVVGIWHIELDNEHLWKICVGAWERFIVVSPWLFVTFYLHCEALILRSPTSSSFWLNFVWPIASWKIPLFHCVINLNLNSYRGPALNELIYWLLEIDVTCCRRFSGFSDLKASYDQIDCSLFDNQISVKFSTFIQSGLSYNHSIKFVLSCRICFVSFESLNCLLLSFILLKRLIRYQY